MAKGCYGYLRRQKKTEIIRTILYFALSLAIFIMGYLSTGTKANLLTIVAVLGSLPASKSMVSMIMYLKAGVCSPDCYAMAQSVNPDGTLLLYDLYLTSYRNNFQISVMAVKNNTVCGYTEDGKCDLSAGEKHISEILQQSGYGGVTVKLFDNREKFRERLTALCAASEKAQERDEAVAQVIKDISL